MRVASAMSPARELSLALAVLALAALLGLSSALGDSATGGASFKEPAGDDQQLEVPAGLRTNGAQVAASGIRANSRLLAVPHSLARFLFYNSRGPSDARQAPAEAAPVVAPPTSFKRSSSQLDALNGVTLGKRSAPLEFVNYEPVFGRQSFLRSPSRVYDMRWAPFDSIENSMSQTNDY